MTTDQGFPVETATGRERLAYIVTLERRNAALLAERDALAQALSDARYLGDNHHNAAACPHCGDLLGKEKGRVAVLEAALRELAYTDVVGDRARCVACKAWWSEYPPTQHEPGCFIGDALAGAVLAGGDAARPKRCRRHGYTQVEGCRGCDEAGGDAVGEETPEQRIAWLERELADRDARIANLREVLRG